MSYASAVLNGVSSDEKPVSSPKPQVQAKPQQPKQQPQKAQAQKPQQEKREEAAQPQQPKVYVKLEGNDGGELGQLFRDEKNHVYTRKGDEGKKNKVVKTDRIFDIVIANVGPVGLSALGRTCKYFLTQVLKNKNIVNDLYARQKIVKPFITFKVDFVESKGEESDEGKEVKSLPLSYFADNPRRQNALCKYWARVVSQAQASRSVDPSKDISSMMGGDKPFEVKLNGGFFFNGNKHGPLVAQRDLSRTLVWLDACVKLLQGKMKQELPYLDGGRVVLTRYGLGGTKIKVETVQGKASEPKPDSPPTIHRYEFAEFCMSLRSAAKAFVPLVGTCVVSMKQGIRNVPQEETDKYLQREKILNSLLKHQQLDTAVKAVKRLLVQGVIPNSELPAMFRKRREEKLRLKAQQAVEFENITKFLLSNVPDDFEEAKLQAERLNEEAKQQKEREKIERQKAFEERLLKKAQEKAGPKKEGSEESKEEKKDVVKTKVVKEVDADGFVLEKVLLVKGGEVLGEKSALREESATTSTERSTPSPVSDFNSNPYTAALQEKSFVSLSEEQHKKNMAKLNGRITAESKQRAKVKKEKKEQAQAQAAAVTGKKQKGGKGGQKPAQKGQQAQPKQQPKQVQPKQQPKQTPAPAQPKKAQPQPKKQAQKKSPKTNKPKRAQTAEIPEPGDFFQPTAIALAVVGALAFGYVLVSGSF